MNKLLTTKKTDWEALQLMMQAQANLMKETIIKHGEKMGRTFRKLSKWLNMGPTPTDFTTMNNFYYILVSLTTNDWYIGSATNGMSRWKQHLMNAKNAWENLKSSRKKHCLMNIHKCMRRTGTHNWIMIPITDTINGKKRIKWKLIKRLKPTLNTLWIMKKKDKTERKRPGKKHRNKKPSETNDMKSLHTTFFVNQIPYVDIFEVLKKHGGTAMKISWL